MNTAKDFQILNKLGEGSFSSVWKVKRISDGQEYAMKKVKMASLSEKEKQNALNEVRILASIKNPYIVGYKEAFFEDNSMTLCVVMEYAGGGDLFNKITAHQKAGTHFKEQDIWKYAIQMIIGLRTLHDMKILHRDLKCANVFVSTDNQSAKLGDLNVSKVAKNNLVYTQTGTPYYASPEVWRDQPYDMKSDIWSLGCVIYEMCALKPPFRANDMQGLFKKIQRGIFEKIPSQYSMDLYNFISMCLQTKPSLRPSCEQLLSHPLVLRNGAEVIQILESLDESNQLLGTIKLPKNIRALAQHLPKADYGDDFRPQTEAADRGRGVTSENIKNANAGYIRRPISQNVPLTTKNILVRDSHSRESRIYPLVKNTPVPSKKESEQEYLARMQRDYIDKAKAIRPLDLMKDAKSPKPSDILVRQKSPSYAQQSKRILERPESRVREEAAENARKELYTPGGGKPRPKLIDLRKGGQDDLGKNDSPRQPAPANPLRINSREKSRGEMGVERLLQDKQEYLINKYQSKAAEDKKVLGKAQSERNDVLLRKADYLIQKYQGIDLYKRDGISSKEEVRRPILTPGNGSRNPAAPQDILDKYKNLYNLKDLNPKSPLNAGQQIPVKKIDYQYLNQNNNNLYVLKKNPVLGANNDNITPVKKHAQIKLSVKPPWWG